ncbi:MAG TPA: hypothetical protein PK777_07675, partial [Thermoguttaceae bacterium]|nr:hypothetical protein [Thermoguttaceae bacterium]
GVGNWLRGIPVSDLLNHAIRHLYLYLAACHMEMTNVDMVDVVWQVPELTQADLQQRLESLFLQKRD